MKKLIIALAAVAAGVAASAATVSWSTSVPTTGLPDGATVVGVAMNIYEITAAEFSSFGDDMAKVYASFSATEDKSSSWNTVIATRNVGNNEKANITSSTAVSSWGAGSTHYIALIAETTVGDTTYYLANTLEATVGTGNNTTTLTSYAAILHGGTTGSATTWTAAPEPTSGLLMVLGAAMVALRRKRA